MKLKFNKNISDSQINVTLTLTNNTINEKKALRILGSPAVVFEKSYDVSGTTVSIDTNISDFNVEYTFIGTTENIAEVVDEVNTFVTDVQEVVTDVMTNLMTAYRAVEKATSSSSGELEIRDGENTNA